jgi:hypothetical protein
MGRTFIRQDAQIASTLTSDVGFLDNKTPTLANYQTNSTDLAYDLNCLRSQLQNFLNRSGGTFPTGKWYDDLSTPSTFESGSARGINEQNQQLHDLERKRVLVSVRKLDDIVVTALQNWEILVSPELPSNTTAAVGSVTTRGTVAAFHSGTFGTHSLDEVSGSTAISPKNLVKIVDAATNDPILSAGREIYALFQTEIATDGHTMNYTNQRAQLSFVRLTSTSDDLEACPVGDIAGKTVHMASVERKALEDLNEQDFLKGAEVDVPSGATVTRQVAYDNQGTTPVEITDNAILDINSASKYWSIRDLANADLFKITEGSTGGTSTVEIAAGVDSFDVNAVLVDFNSGITVRSGGARDIDIGVTDGVIETTAGALEVQAKTTLSFDDGFKPAGWSLTEGVHLSDAGAEWTLFEANFGEVSLLNAINQAYAGAQRTKVQAVMIADVNAGVDVNGPTYDANCDVDLPPYNLVGDFVNDVEVYLNGELLRNSLLVGQDVYQGTTPSTGDLMFTFKLKGTGAKPDQLTVIVNGQ